MDKHNSFRCSCAHSGEMFSNPPCRANTFITFPHFYFAKRERESHSMNSTILKHVLYLQSIWIPKLHSEVDSCRDFCLMLLRGVDNEASRFSMHNGYLLDGVWKSVNSFNRATNVENAFISFGSDRNILATQKMKEIFVCFWRIHSPKKSKTCFLIRLTD